MLKSISISVEHGEEKIYHNTWEPYEHRDIRAVIQIYAKAKVFGEDKNIKESLEVPIPKHLEDKFVALWYEVEQALESE